MGQEFAHLFGTRTHALRRIAGAYTGRGVPDRTVTPCEYRYRGRAHRTGPALFVLRNAWFIQPCPNDTAGEAQIVEPAEVVTIDARREHFRFPSRGRHLEAFEIGKYAGKRVRTLLAVGGADVLPVAQ